MSLTAKFKRMCYFFYIAILKGVIYKKKNSQMLEKMAGAKEILL